MFMQVEGKWKEYKELMDEFLMIEQNAKATYLSNMALESYKVPIYLSHTVIINGTGGSGKDTFVDLCGNIIAENNSSNLYHAYLWALSSIDAVKTAASYLIGEEAVNEKTEKVRQLLSDLKSRWISYDNYGSTDYIVKKIVPSIDASSVWNVGNINMGDPMHRPFLIVFIHIREPKEINKMKCAFRNTFGDNYPITTVLVEGRVEPDQHENSSDRMVQNYEYDVKVPNVGTKLELCELAESFVNTIIANTLENVNDRIARVIQLYDSYMTRLSEDHSDIYVS